MRGRDTPQIRTPGFRGLPFGSGDPGPEFPEFPDPSPNKTESISSLSEEPQDPGKQLFSGISWIRTTQYSES